LIKFKIDKALFFRNNYRKRWLIATQDSYKRYILIRAKNSGNYRIAGDSTWLSFQDKYWIVNMLNRIINACRIAGYDVVRDELQKIGSEFADDVKIINAEINTEQKEWLGMEWMYGGLREEE
jgi:hypothetical protein